MTEQNLQQLTELSAYLAARRQIILEEWRKAAHRDPKQTVVKSLTQAQFYDHIPQVLEAFERKLRARPGGSQAAAADDAKSQEEVKHGLHRWQQGYPLKELVHEWGHLHHQLSAEVERFAVTQSSFDRDTQSIANQALIQLVNESISESVGQYGRLQQAEAAGHLRDLQQALSRMNEVDRQRANLIHQAVHDLRGNVQSVSSAAEVLRSSEIAEAERREFLDMLSQGTGAVSAMLGDLMALARLEAGQERREIAPFDASTLFSEFCTAFQPFARERGIYLVAKGLPALPVEGDANKVRRLVQNLALNGLKYTEVGGVTISWGEEHATSWWFMVKDTGPGLVSGPGAPVVKIMAEATASAREAAEDAAVASGGEPTVIKLPASDSGATHSQIKQQPGEGIGLSIVKRLCELLDASLELTSSAENGTTFRVVMPRRYESEPARQPR